MKNTRNSNRRYPTRYCKQTGEAFIPTDKRQVFSSAQERINYHNDQRSIKEAPLKKEMLELAKNDAILEKVYNKIKTKKLSPIVNKNLLVYEDFDFYAPHRTMYNEETKKPIQWYSKFGLEVVANQDGMVTYKIHKK